MKKKFDNQYKLIEAGCIGSWPSAIGNALVCVRVCSMVNGYQ